MKNPYPTIIPPTILSLLLILAWTSGISQSINPSSNSNRISIGQRDSVYSEILAEKRRLFIYLPPGADRPDKKQYYPVVYLLDGGLNFVAFVGALEYLSQVNSLCPPMIVVGILNTDRMRDLTPTHYASPRADSVQFITSGGGEAFTKFLEKELIPYIDFHYPTAPERMLIGHSLGGLMVINTFLYHSNLFKHYLSIDPSLTWDDQKLLNQYVAALPGKKFDNNTLFLTATNFTGLDSTLITRDTSRATMPTRSIFAFARELAAKKDPGLDWACKYYPSESHFTVPLPSEYDALKFIFRKKTVHLSPNQLQALAGKYQFQFTPGKDEFLLVTAGIDHLVVKQLWDGMEFEVVPESALTFYCKLNPFTVTFIKNTKGQITQALVQNSDLWKRVNK